jgi:hypothetical protein
MEVQGNTDVLLDFQDTLVRATNSPGHSPWNSKDFIRPTEGNSTNSINTIFGSVAKDSKMCFMLQLIVAMASLPDLGFCANTDLKRNLEMLMKAYGAVVYYTKIRGAFYRKDEELKTVVNSKLFDEFPADSRKALVQEGEEICRNAFEEAIKMDSSIKNNCFHFFSLNSTFENFVNCNSELMQRVMPIVYACRNVMQELKMPIPSILTDESLKSQTFVIVMFHAPRMAVPYISWYPTITAKACMAIQLYKQNYDESRKCKRNIMEIFDHFHFMVGLFNNDMNALEKFCEFIGVNELDSNVVIDILLIYNSLLFESCFDIGVVKCLENAFERIANASPNFMDYMHDATIKSIPHNVPTMELVEQVLSDKSIMFVCKYIVTTTYLRNKQIDFHPYSSVKELEEIFVKNCKPSEQVNEFSLQDKLSSIIADIAKLRSESTHDGKSRIRRRPLRPNKPLQTQTESNAV